MSRQGVGFLLFNMRVNRVFIGVLELGVNGEIWGVKSWLLVEVENMGRLQNVRSEGCSCIV